MKSKEIRKQFLKYFEEKDHTLVASSSLVPEGDNTLLFTNAGMNQFKNIFLGVEKRPYKRATSSQKCVRAGGKHNDLEQVGHTARHHTFFEMLGNFSFGNYFKKDAIHFAWELLTKEFKIDKNRLYVTVFETDNEAAEIWLKQERVPQDRIFKFGEKDNFWRMGDTGPCGPCSEIYYDLGSREDGSNKNAKFGEDENRFFEIWNLVFMQYNENENKKLNPLPKPSVDTGAGLERMAAVLQNVQDNFETDSFAYLIKKAEKIAESFNPETRIATRVLADHSRTTAFLMADGVLPSNEGRGYVLRRIMRRAIRYGRNLSKSKSLLVPLVECVIENMRDDYPELESQKKLILKSTKSEEESFLKTLDQGTDILSFELDKLKKSNQKTLKGDVVFKLYDTFGFPVDLTRIMSEERGYRIDESGFEESMAKARALSQSSWKGQSLSTDQAKLIEATQSLPKTKFLGYDSTLAEAKIIKLIDSVLISDQTPFYAESGGQVGDKGTISSSGATANILDTTQIKGVYLHHIEGIKGKFKEGEKILFQVSESERRDTANNHTATHLLHAALRKILGDHVTQAGSLVEASRLRFDFTHDRPVKDEELVEIENLVNDQISNAIEVETQQMGFDEAIKSGAMALFGEKYGDTVRVLKVGDFSTELCGGTHVKNTSTIRAMLITGETGVSRGVRRIEAVTGRVAVGTMLSATKELHQAKQASGAQNLVSWLEERKKEIKHLEKKLQNISSQNFDLDLILNSAKSFSGGKYISANLEIEDRNTLSAISDKLKDKVKSGVVFIVGRGQDTHPVIVSVSKDLTSKFNAGKLLQEVAPLLGGKGGGRPDFAQGAVSDISKFEKANSKLQDLLKVQSS